MLHSCFLSNYGKLLLTLIYCPAAELSKGIFKGDLLLSFYGANFKVKISRLHLTCEPPLGSVLEELPVGVCLQAEVQQTSVLPGRAQCLQKSRGPAALPSLHAVPMAYRMKRRFLLESPTLKEIKIRVDLHRA